MRTSGPILAAALMLAGPAAVPASDNSAPPLPALETILQRVAEKAAQEDENERMFRDRYFYTRNRVTEFRNSQGELKKREEKNGDHDPLASNPPVRPPPARPQSSRADAAAENRPVSDTHSNVRGKAFKKGEFVLNDDLLGRFEFQVAGRETVNGRPALMVDFQPAKKKLPVRNVKDKFINKAAGRVWVDEADYALVKADLHLTDRVNVVGGLVGAVWKFTFAFTRERTPDGLWFTRDSRWHLEGREVFVQRTVDYHEERLGVRRVIGAQTSLHPPAADSHSFDDDPADE
jgi:hypothetical protein